MLIVMSNHATPDQVDHVMDQIRLHGMIAEPVPGSLRTAVCVLGNKGSVDASLFAGLPGVSQCIPVTKPYKLVSRETQAENSIITVNGVSFGDRGPISIIAGPCAVESREQIFAVGEYLASRGVRLMRGGAFKPRTSPYSFQGLGSEALGLMDEVRKTFGLALVAEAIDHENYNEVEDVVDVVQIGARNMQNFSLLRRAGAGCKPVLLKRGMSATMDEFLMAAEYIMSGGNRQVILCERGVRTFADHTRNTLDLSAVPLVQARSHLPIVVDPSHAAGVRDFVAPLSMGAQAVGADGLMIEIHPDPTKALSDGPQSLTFNQFDELLKKLGRF